MFRINSKMFAINVRTKSHNSMIYCWWVSNTNWYNANQCLAGSIFIPVPGKSFSRHSGFHSWMVCCVPWSFLNFLSFLSFLMNCSNVFWKLTFYSKWTQCLLHIRWIYSSVIWSDKLIMSSTDFVLLFVS